MLNTKITYALAEWIQEWMRVRNVSPSIDECIKFVDWKIGDYVLSTNDKIQIEAILLYETSELEN
tara:strand:+ start:7526 stop:7720 length:195 start_codon:yes stop_codon:yes gene_type:complete